MQAASERESTEWLDAARAIAILGVVMVHTSQYTGGVLAEMGKNAWAPLDSVLSLGRYGVELFFFVSGWLFGLLYGDQLDARKYAIRRFARIWPLWAMFAILGVAESQFLNTGPWHSTLQSTTLPPAIAFLMTLTFTGWLSSSVWNTSIPGGWSIQVEVGHYLIFPWLRRLSVHGISLFALGAASLGALLSIISHSSSPALLVRIVRHIDQFGVVTTVLFFLFGFLARELIAALRGEPMNRLAKVTESQKAQAALALLVALFLLPTMHLPNGTTTEALGYVCAAVPAALLLVRTPGRSFAMWLGKRSYFVYFCHFWLLASLSQYIEKLTPLETLPSKVAEVIVVGTLFLGTLLVASLISELSYRYFERPILDLAHRKTV